MFLVYFDETGDPGALPGSTPYFIVSALFVQEHNWESVFAAMKDFRKHLRAEYGIPLAAEIKGYSIIRGRLEPTRKAVESGVTRRLKRLTLLKEIVKFLGNLSILIEVQNVCFKKSFWPTNKKEAQSLSRERFVRTWQYSLQRAEAHVYYYEQRKKSEMAANNSLKTMQSQASRWLSYQLANERGLLFPDQTQSDLLRKLSRKMHVYNYVPYKGIPFQSDKPTRQVPIRHILGDPSFIESKHSYFVQFTDIIGYCLSKYCFPETIAKRYKTLRVAKTQRLENLFPLLEPILCKRAAPEEPLGVKFLHDQQKMPPETGGICADLPPA